MNPGMAVFMVGVAGIGVYVYNQVSGNNVKVATPIDQAYDEVAARPQLPQRFSDMFKLYAGAASTEALPDPAKRSMSWAFKVKNREYYRITAVLEPASGGQTSLDFEEESFNIPTGGDPALEALDYDILRGMARPLVMEHVSANLLDRPFKGKMIDRELREQLGKDPEAMARRAKMEARAAELAAEKAEADRKARRDAKALIERRRDGAGY